MKPYLSWGYDEFSIYQASQQQKCDRSNSESEKGRRSWWYRPCQDPACYEGSTPEEHGGYEGDIGHCKCVAPFSALLRKNVNKKQVSEDSEKTEESFDNK